MDAATIGTILGAAALLLLGGLFPLGEWQALLWAAAFLVAAELAVYYSLDFSVRLLAIWSAALAAGVVLRLLLALGGWTTRQRRRLSR